MEAEKLQTPQEQSLETVVCVSLNGENEETISLLRHLVAEASTNYPQLSRLRFVTVLPTARLKTWTYWLAVEAIAQWQELPVENFSVAAVTKELGLTSVEDIPLLTALDKTVQGTSCLKELSRRILALQERLPQSSVSYSYQRQWLKQEVNALAEWFYQKPTPTSTPSQSLAETGGCLAQLQSNALVLRSQILSKLQESIAGIWQAGTQSVLQHLRFLIEALQDIQANFEAQRRECLRRESAAWRAFKTLSEKLVKSNRLLSSSRNPDWSAVLRALALAYNLKLEGKIYQIASQLLEVLVQQTQAYTATVDQTNVLLMTMQEWLTEGCDTQPVFIPLLREYLADQVNPAQLRRELEGWTGHSLNQWGACESIQVEALQQEILLRIRPIAMEMYAECCQSALS